MARLKRLSGKTSFTSVCIVIPRSKATRNPYELSGFIGGTPISPRHNRDSSPALRDRNDKKLSFSATLKPCPLMNSFGFSRHVVHQQVLAQGIGRREVGLAAAHLGHFLDELHQAVIAGQHEGID